ncbi:MAG: hypothetical protein U5K43_08310 [Halofilum sp. (in: g-proteobacteria)]|nr:hypothetical protein [Halofilum sp. (in: g-proteobacteria)]
MYALGAFLGQAQTGSFEINSPLGRIKWGSELSVDEVHTENHDYTILSREQVLEAELTLSGFSGASINYPGAR